MPTIEKEVTKIECYGCGEEIKKDDRSYEFGNDTYCRSCTFDCANCSERACDSWETDDGDVCETCRDNRYTCCRNCERVLHENSDNWGGDGYCDNCAENQFDFPYRAWKNTGRHLDGKAGKIMQSVRPFGLECEMGYNNDLESVNDVAAITDDWDIGITEDAGAEFQTPPASGHKAEDLIGAMTDAFIKHKFTAKDGQGLHVHIDCSELKDMTAEDRFKRIQDLWLTYIVFDSTIRRFINKYRQDKADTSADDQSFYRKMKHEYEEIAACKNERDLEKMWYGEDRLANIDQRKKGQKDGTRYHGFNLHSLFNGYHLEIRYHESVVEARPMLEWANLHCLIMDKCMQGVDREWLEKIRTKMLKRKALFDFVGLADSSRKYFRKKTTNLIKLSGSKKKKVPFMTTYHGVYSTTNTY